MPAGCHVSTVSSNSTVSCAAMLPSSSFRSSGTGGAAGGGSCSSAASSSSVSSSSSATTTTSSSTSSSSCDCRPYGGVLSLSSSDSSSDAKSIVASAASGVPPHSETCKGAEQCGRLLGRRSRLFSKPTTSTTTISHISLKRRKNMRMAHMCKHVQRTALKEDKGHVPDAVARGTRSGTAGARSSDRSRGVAAGCRA